ncbi:cupin domain-containing protein [Actinocorallia sp. A-T 12471]|uniref:cupin domain-containing protein n=1 Tax=Actinocorallia sp. A-T 12471 TaxID=3089813 RepID=UPI0029D1B627|nr:cupin domain-containing protein [Actinocorallia sp. A-T 12471]MDX6741548.1 cupin domain-containing protein [Actinocorallia sp. A-T 12471]
MTPLEPVRRVVTGHDGDGRAVVVADEVCPHQWEPPDGGTVFEIWRHDGVPDNAKPYEDPIGATPSLPPPPAGTVCRVVDFAPRTDESVYLHRTSSLDYCYVIEGEIHAVLDDSERLLRAGDLLVQRGTRHGWLNRSGGICRVLFVLVDAEPLPAADHRAG